jgi:hypothetical protein
MTRAVAVAVATVPADVGQRRFQERQVPDAVHDAPTTDEPTGRTGRRRLAVSSSVDWNSCGSSVASNAGPTVSYSISARKAPSTLPTSPLLRALLAPLGVLLDTFVVRTLLVPALAVDVGPRALVAQRPGSPTSRTDNRRRIGRAGRAVARRLT